MVGYLVLENGDIFEGERIGYNIDTACEVVFNTSMVGYIENLTDPSYAGQGVVMTYPLIGNYGIIPEDYESDNIWVKAIFIHKLAEFESNFRAKGSLEKILRDYKIPGLTNINTRKLTKVLRDNGTMKGYITSDINNLEEIHKKIKSYEIKDVIEKVSTKNIKTYGKSKEKQVALIDYGFKHDIVNNLLKKGVGVTIYPANISAEKIIETRPDGIILSNGPGNPSECEKQIENVKKLYNSEIPIMGIALGHQLMGLATGAKTEKLKYGHRGPSHPVKNLENGKIYITNQNHGYHILKDSINKNIAEISHENLNDGTVEGLRYHDKKIFTIQFYPENSEEIYDEFIKSFNN